MEVWKIIFLSKWLISRFDVNLPGCSKANISKFQINFGIRYCKYTNTIQYLYITCIYSTILQLKSTEIVVIVTGSFTTLKIVDIFKIPLHQNWHKPSHVYHQLKSLLEISGTLLNLHSRSCFFELLEFLSCQQTGLQQFNLCQCSETMLGTQTIHQKESKIVKAPQAHIRSY